MISIKYTITVLALSAFDLTIAQQLKPLTNKEDQQCKDYSQKIEMRNINEIVGKYVKACKMVPRTSHNKLEIVEINPINTGRKDAKGNDIFHINVLRGGKQVGYMVPEFEDYPLNMVYFRLENYTLSEQGNHTRIGYSDDIFVLPTETFTFSDHSYQWILSKDMNSEQKDSRIRTYWIQRKCIAGEGPDAKPRVEHNLADMHKYFMERYDAIEAYNQKQLNYASTHTYSEAMNEVLNKPEYFLFQKDFYMDSLKITSEKDAAGNVNKLIFQYPFFGKYVDNEKFKLTVTKNSAGYFEVPNAPEFMHLQRGILVPFDGKLLLAVYQDYQKVYSPFQFISSTPFDAQGLNILHGSKVYNPYSGTHPYKDEHSEFNEWYMKKFMETSVEYYKDNRHIDVLLTNYMAKMKKK